MYKTKKYPRFAAIVACSVLLFALFLTGCMGEKEEASSAYRVTDAEGTVVEIPHKPRRILTISAGTDEMMLGLVEPERMAAVNDSLADEKHTNVPWVREKIPTVITRSPSVEQVAALSPDIIIVTPWLPRENADAMRALGVPVVVCRAAATMEDIHANIRLFAAAVDEKERGERLIAKMEEKLAEIEEKMKDVPEEKKHKSIALISIMPNYGGAGCTFDELCSHTASINAKAAAGNRMGQEMTKEQLVAANPDYIFLPSYEDAGTREENYGRQYMEDPSLQQMTAVREKQIGHPWARYVYNISQNIIFGVQETAWILYGDAFRQSRQEFLSAVE